MGATCCGGAEGRVGYEERQEDNSKNFLKSWKLSCLCQGGANAPGNYL